MSHNTSNSQQLLVFVSDGTGVASETLGLTVMTQLGDYTTAQHETLPFIRTIEEAISQVNLINSWKSTTYPVRKSWRSLLAKVRNNVPKLVMIELN